MVLFLSRSTRQRGCRLLSTLIFSLFFTGLAMAQTLYGNLTGNVTDASNAAVPA